MILVTGGSGLVGSHLLYHLTSKGYKVKALIRHLSKKDLVNKTFLFYTNEPEKLMENITWTYGDLTDIISLEDAFNEVEYVYNTAALVSFRKNKRKELFNTNVKGTANLVNLCHEKGIKKLCHVSSIGALGESEDNRPITEDLLWKPSKGVSSYSLSKYLSEMEVWRGITEGLNAVIVNPSVILGPGDWNKGTPSFISLIDKGFRYYTNGVTGYVDVRDVVEIMVKLMESELSGERYTISSENISYKNFLDTIATKLGKQKTDIHFSKGLGDIFWRIEAILSIISRREPRITRETAHIAFNSSNYTTEKLQKVLPYSFRSIDQSIGDIVNLYLNHPK